MGDGSGAPEEGCHGSSQGHRCCERGQPRNVEGGLRGHQRGNRTHDRLSAGEPDNGRLQRLLRARARGSAQYLMSTVNEADAKRAYSALMQFKDVVKANPITPQVKETPAALSKLGAIDAAAAKLSA